MEEQRADWTERELWPAGEMLAHLNGSPIPEVTVGQDPCGGEDGKGVSTAFHTFLKEAPELARAWMGAMHALETASGLDRRTGELACLAVLAALRLTSGVPFHVRLAKEAGASRNEVVSAILTGLPLAGHGVLWALPAALAAYDSD